MKKATQASDDISNTNNDVSTSTSESVQLKLQAATALMACMLKFHKTFVIQQLFGNDAKFIRRNKFPDNFIKKDSKKDTVSNYPERATVKTTSKKLIRDTTRTWPLLLKNAVQLCASGRYVKMGGLPHVKCEKSDWEMCVNVYFVVSTADLWWAQVTLTNCTLIEMQIGEDKC